MESKEQQELQEINAHVADPFIGKVLLGRYRVDSLLGSGGWGNVYLGAHLSLDAQIAIKVLHQHFARDEERQKRLEQEAKVLSKVDSQFVVKTLDYGLNPIAFIVMEYFDGVPLSEILEKEGAIKQEEAIVLFEQLCEGLGAAHAVGLVHRDLKPSNILVKRGDNGEIRCKILDFGVAKILNDSSGNNKLTATGEILGSPAYMSPEQWTARQLDQRSDIYSLGCLMYEVLCRKPMFEAENSYEYLNLHLATDPKPFAKQAPEQNVSAELEKVVRKCVQKDPQDRYPSVEELFEDLEKVRSGQRVTMRLKAATRANLSRTKHSVKWPAYAIGAISLVSLGALYYFHEPILVSLCTNINKDADSAYKAGKAEQAIGGYRSTIMLAQYLPKQDKRKLHAMRSLAESLQKNGSFAEASKLKDQVTELTGSKQPADWQAIYNRANNEKSHGRWGRAEAYAKEAIRLAERYAGKSSMLYALSVDLLGSVYQQSGRGAQAVGLQQEALQLTEDLLDESDQQIPQRLNNLGLCLRQQSAFEDAKKAYQRAIEYAMRYNHPELAVRPWNNTGTIFIMQKDYEKGLAACQHALELDKKTGDSAGSSIMDHIAVIYFRQGQFPKAIEAFEKALEYRKKEGSLELPGANETYQNMGEVYMLWKKPDKALACFQRCLDIQMKNNPESREVARFKQSIRRAEDAIKKSGDADS